MNASQRLRSGAAASISGRGLAPLRLALPIRPHHNPIVSMMRRRLLVVRKAEPDATDALLEEALSNDPSAPPAGVRRARNSRPDFENPDWAAGVDDWDEFWRASAYEESDLAELASLETVAASGGAAADIDADEEAADYDEDGDDAAAAAAALDPLGAGAVSAGGRAGADGGAAALERARALIGALGNAAKAGTAVQILTPPRTKPDLYRNYAELPPDHVTVNVPNPNVDDFYLRAMVEKAARREALDAEWRRRQSLVGVLPPHDYSTDVRLEHDHVVREQWTHEQIVELIEGGGKYAPMEVADRAAEVINPLRPIDYHNDLGVEAIPDTEDFIRACGRMLEGQDALSLDAEVELGEADFVDPSVAFRDEDGNVYLGAPPNEWAHLRARRTAADIAAVIGDDGILAGPPRDDGGVIDASAAAAAAQQQRDEWAAGRGGSASAFDDGEGGDPGFGDDEWQEVV